MDKTVFEKILRAQEKLYCDPEYQVLMEEYTKLQAQFLEQIETMNPKQRETVWDYCGLLIEMHLHTLEIIAS